jgi:TRAP transporter TAXI family solute receptor
LRLIQKGEAHTAICQNDAVFYAQRGLKFFEGKAVAKVRGVLMLYDEYMHAVTTKQTGIKSIPDLRGRRVRVGYPGSISLEDNRAILSEYGMAFDDMKSVQMSLTDSIKQLKDGDIEASMEFVGYPAAGWIDFATHRDMVILEIDKEHADKISQKYPFMSSAVIPAGTYRGVDKDVSTLALTCMLVATTDLSTDLVYKLTKAVFEHLDILIETHAKGKLVTLETALKGMPVPLHPGAEKYYREVGMIK